MRKYRFRVFISLFIFLFFRLTSTECLKCFFVWDTESTIYLSYVVTVVLVCWEVINYATNYFSRTSSISSNADLFKISIKAGLIILPFVGLFSWIASALIDPYLYETGMKNEMRNNFWVMSAQGFLLSQLIILYEIIRIYIKQAVKEAKEKEEIKKELVAAQYEGLKNQVNPHFLFNSFSVLSSLVEKNSNDAIEFISKLSDLYRYILENDNKSFVSAEEELGFLEDYIYLLKMRHGTALVVEKQLNNLDLNAQLPPLSLQTLFENAVKHNSFSKSEPLKIRIFASDKQHIEVQNKKVIKPALVKSTGIGLKNLSKRLKLLTGKGLTIVEDEVSFKVSFALSQ